MSFHHYILKLLVFVAAAVAGGGATLVTHPPDVVCHLTCVLVVHIILHFKEKQQNVVEYE